MVDSINNKYLKFIVIAILTLLIVFMVIAFPTKYANTNESNIVSIR